MKPGEAPATEPATTANQTCREQGTAEQAVTAPKVSVVIPCYNHGRYLGEALASVRAQTLRDVEIIVVDDGSTDAGTLRVLDELTGSDVQVLRVPNQGPAAARNAGIRQARGTYLLPLDADDRIAPTYLEQAVTLLDHDPAVGVVYGRVELFGAETGLWDQPDYSSALILLENMVVATAVFRRADWQRVGGYRAAMRSGWEDWDFWLALVEQGRQFVRLPDVLFHYRIRHDSRDRSLTLPTKARLMLQLVRNHPALYLQRLGPALLALRAARAGRGRGRTAGRIAALLERCRRTLRMIAERLYYATRRSAGHRRFFILTCERNAGTDAIRCLESVYRQKYDRAKVRHLFIDDASDDGTHGLVTAWLAAHPDHAVDYRHNAARCGGTANTLTGLRLASGDAIVVELNGDDRLPDDGVLRFFDKVYADPEVWMTYNTLRVNGGPPVPWARPIPAAVVAANAYRDQPDWQTSHLHTFRRELLDHIDDSLFVDPETGAYWECADDQALYLALLELTGAHARHIDRITCEYNFHEASHAARDNRKSQELAQRIRRGKRFSPLASLSGEV